MNGSKPNRSNIRLMMPHVAATNRIACITMMIPSASVTNMNRTRSQATSFMRTTRPAAIEKGFFEIVTLLGIDTSMLALTVSMRVMIDRSVLEIPSRKLTSPHSQRFVTGAYSSVGSGTSVALGVGVGVAYWGVTVGVGLVGSHVGVSVGTVVEYGAGVKVGKSVHVALGV
jgi:hypothetical protein